MNSEQNFSIENGKNKQAMPFSASEYNRADHWITYLRNYNRSSMNHHIQNSSSNIKGCHVTCGWENMIVCKSGQSKGAKNCWNEIFVKNKTEKICLEPTEATRRRPWKNNTSLAAKAHLAYNKMIWLSIQPWWQKSIIYKVWSKRIILTVVVSLML